MADDLDSLVKGAPLPGSDLAEQTPFMLGGGLSPIAASSSAKAGDPLSHTPSSPSMIYLNLLVLEASLRAQYLELRARRRHHTFFLILLSGWILGFGYALFLAPREDGSGVGGSVYWVVDVAEKVCFMGGVITAALVWATGIWERGVRWPRRWFSVSNRGLRHINCKLVLMKRPWWAEALATLGWFLTYGVFSNSGGASSYRYVEPAILREVDRELHLSSAGGGSGHTSVSAAERFRDEEKGAGGSGRHGSRSSNASAFRGGHEEDLAPGGDHVKLLLLAKPFSPAFRENWELYRQEYWDRENERRALIRRKLKEQDRALRRASGSWFWWLPRPPRSAEQQQRLRQQLMQQQQHQQPQQQRSPAGSLRGDDRHHHHPQHARLTTLEREHRRTRSSSSRRSSMSMSGGSAAAADAGASGGGGGGGGGGATAPGGGTWGGAAPAGGAAPVGAPATGDDPAVVSRKSSTGSNASDRRRKKSSVSGQGSLRSSAGSARRPTIDRAATPETPSPLAKESSFFSSAGTTAEDRRGSRLQ